MTKEKWLDLKPGDVIETNENWSSGQKIIGRITTVNLEYISFIILEGTTANTGLKVGTITQDAVYQYYHILKPTIPRILTLLQD